MPFAEQSVEVLEAAYGKHSRQRRNHSKGLGALGSFVGKLEMARYSHSALFSGKAIEVIARFSIAGGDPVVSDADRSTRRIGLQFRLPDGVLHHITMLNTPMFFAAIPRPFNEKTAALIPNRHTGEPDPQRFRAYLDAHPENAGQATCLVPAFGGAGLS